MPIPWNATLAVEGVETSDRRLIMPNALSWRELPIPLMAIITDSHGGMPTTQSVNVGRIETIMRVPADDLALGAQRLVATGVFDDTDPVAAGIARKVGERYLRGVSVDVGDVESEFEILAEDEDGWPTDWLDRMTAGRIGMATICGMPAFEACVIELAAEDAMAASAALPALPADLTAHAVDGPGWSLVAAGGPLAAPRAWFDDPQLDGPTALTITDDGRVYGHVALWGIPHLAIPGAYAPRSKTGYAHFLTGSHVCDDGTELPIGKLTSGIGHAPVRGITREQAEAHYYDNSDAVWALVTAGEDEWGPWVAGTVKPGISDERIVEVRACGLSGDWRKYGGHLEMVAALSVPTGGFPIPRVGLAASAFEEPEALVAAGGRAVLEAARRRNPLAEMTVRVDTTGIAEEVGRAVARALHPLTSAAERERLRAKMTDPSAADRAALRARMPH